MTFPGSLARASAASAGEPGARHRRRLVRDRRPAAAARLGLAHPRRLRRARAARLGARHAARRCSPRTALLPLCAAAPAGGRGHAQDRGDRRRQRPRPPPRRAPARRPDARRALRRLLRRPRRRPPARPAGRARTSARSSASPTTRARTASTSSTSRCRWPRSRASCKLLEDLRDTTASIYFVPDIFVSDLIQARVDFDRRPAGGGGVRDAVLRLQRPGQARRATSCSRALILLLISPLMLAIAIGVKLLLARPGAVQAAPLRRRRQQDRGLQVPLDDRGRGRRRGAPGDAQRQPHHAASAPSCAAPRSTSCRSSSTCCRGA